MSAVACCNSDQTLLKQAHLLVDARKIADGGIGRYIRTLLQAVQPSFKKLSIIVPQSFDRSLVGSEVECITSSVKGYSISELFSLARSISWQGVDLFHCPHFTLPYFVPVPTVVTVHDLIQITHPQHWWYPTVAAPLVGSALRRADSLIAVSESTRAEILKRFPDKNIAAKLRVVPNILPPLSEALNSSAASIVPSKPYILAVLSNDKPHKGIQRLLEAFALLNTNDVQLVLAGQGSQSVPSSASVLSLGNISDQQLAQLYSKAKALVVASSVEGFCLPVLEAQSLGVPASTRTFLAAA